MEPPKTTEKCEERKQVLYVERDYLDGRFPESVPMAELSHNDGYYGFCYVREALRARFDLEWMHNFDEKVFSMIQASLLKRKVDALVTHLPYEENKSSDWRSNFFHPMLYYSTIYGKSLDLISRIRDVDPDIMILVYSGMPEDYHYLPRDSGADSIIKKSSSIEQDVIDLNSSLDYLFRAMPEIRKKRKERAIEAPIITTKDNKTIVETTVNIRGGMGSSAYMRICEESRKYPGNVNLENLSEGEIGNCKDLLSLLGILAFEGSSIRISVDGDSSEAQILAKKLYSVVTSEEERKIDINRFD